MEEEEEEEEHKKKKHQEETDSIATNLSQVFLSVFLSPCLETKNRE
jgi:hypothetical protein